MDSKCLSPCIFHILLFLTVWSTYINCQSNIFYVNEKSGSNADFVGAWKKACQTSGGVFNISPGNYTLSGEVLFSGPCNGNTTVRIEGIVKASDELTLPSGYWIGFKSVNGLTINGHGTLDGNGHAVWGRTHEAPTLLKFESISNVRIQDITLRNSKMFHMKLENSQHVTVYHLNISAPENSPNTDGIHVASSNDIRITDSQIATGDDCISLGDGSSNVNITGIFCGPGHGISIGSLGKFQNEKDVSLITVTNCTLTNTHNGIRIKTFASPVSLNVSTVTYQHIVMNNVHNPIIIDQKYCPNGQCPKGPGASSVQIKGVKFIDVEGSSTEPVAVKLDCSQSRPCQDIQFSGANINFNGKPTSAVCFNADAKFTGPKDQVPSKCSAAPAV